MSVDFNHDPARSIFDATLTKVSTARWSRCCAWYDNEWGFSNRMLDTTLAWSQAAEAKLPMKVLRMTDLDLRGKRVLIRDDLNVPSGRRGHRATRASAPRCPTIQARAGRGRAR